MQNVMKSPILVMVIFRTTPGSCTKSSDAHRPCHPTGSRAQEWSEAYIDIQIVSRARMSKCTILCMPILIFTRYKITIIYDRFLRELQTATYIETVKNIIAMLLFLIHSFVHHKALVFVCLLLLLLYFFFLGGDFLDFFFWIFFFFFCFVCFWVLSIF